MYKCINRTFNRFWGRVGFGFACRVILDLCFFCFIPSALPLFSDEMNREHWPQLSDEQKNRSDILERSQAFLAVFLVYLIKRYQTTDAF